VHVVVESLVTYLDNFTASFYSNYHTFICQHLLIAQHVKK
jgi:hypothetical protein